MQTIRESSALRPALAALRGAGERLALVPTMGALHAGHLALVTAAKQRAQRVAATIFVNPLQFAPGEDLDRYPRQEAHDLAMLEEAGCALVWMPTVADLYPDGFATTIHVAGTSEQWEGAARPGHFDGVATVVTKLLIATMPDIALFGEKDYQQLAVIRRLVADLGLPTEIAGVPTVRDGDGLALSSRNAYLSPDERRRALALPKALGSVRDAVRSGEPVKEAVDAARQLLAQAGFDPIDYLALVDSATLEPLDALAGQARVIAAARIGTTRLIDNIAV
ncbi:pantoate--beta-alanine ligase [Sphingomonas sp.]|uniref:pantoate--beta-alanine ligase n=1 Tax=Sphingomonas sp. TaxID=28214 RepID=UPI00286CEB4F|nr:pantoate--beta-alanine ligase [Sphingomonas sp.]